MSEEIIQNNNTQNEYHSSLDDIIEQKDIVDAIEGKILYLNSQKEIHHEKNQFPYIPVIFPTCLIMALIVAPWFLNSLVEPNTDLNMVNTILGTMSETQSFTLTVSSLLLPIGAIAEGISFHKYRKYQKEEKGIDASLEYLNWQLQIEKKKLEEIKQEKINDYGNAKENSISYLDKLKQMRKDLDFYYDIGYNSQKYYQYYKDNMLDEKLKDKYDEDEIRSIESYMHEKGHILTLKKDNK